MAGSHLSAILRVYRIKAVCAGPVSEKGLVKAHLVMHKRISCQGEALLGQGGRWRCFDNKLHLILQQRTHSGRRPSGWSVILISLPNRQEDRAVPTNHYLTGL